MRLPGWMKILLGALAALAAVYAASLLMRPGPAAVLTVPAEVAKFEVARGSSAVTLQKSSGTWRVVSPVDFPANQEVATAFVESIQDMSVGEALTQREESHGLYEVTEASGVRVKLYGPGQKEPLTLVFGKMAADYSHIYLKTPPSPAVYLALGPLRHELEKDVDGWRDKRLLSTNPGEAVSGLRIGPGDGFEIAKSSDLWRVNGQAVDGAKIDSLLSQFQAMAASRFSDQPSADELKKWGLAPPLKTFSFSLSSGRRLNLSLGRKDAAKHEAPLQRENEPVVFWLPDYFLENLPAKPSDLVGPASSKK